MKIKSSIFIVLCLLSINQYSYSQIYKWVDKNGDIQFSDKKPQTGNKTEQVRVKINSVHNPRISTNTLNFNHSQDSDTSSENQYASVQKVIIYSADWCGVCKQAKQYFNRQGVAYKEYDIEKSAKGRKDFKRLRARGVPVILVGKQRMDGFNISAFEKMYRG